MEDLDLLERQLVDLGADFTAQDDQQDHYLAHPSRDFKATDEALRIRQFNGQAVVTYKGPRIAGPVKIRPEMEIPLVEATSSVWLSLFQSLGFKSVATVSKVRRSFNITYQSYHLTVTLDRVQKVGTFAEIELIVQDRSGIESAQRVILDFAAQLHLDRTETRSYLAMLLRQSEGESSE